MEYLAGTRSVHTTASICDYLDGRTTPNDTVTVVAVASADDPTARRDAKEALNVASVRLATVDDVRTTLREDTELSAALLEAATDADEVVITPRSDGAETPGSTVRSLLEAASLPVVVVPTAEF